VHAADAATTPVFCLLHYRQTADTQLGGNIDNKQQTGGCAKFAARVSTTVLLLKLPYAGDAALWTLLAFDLAGQFCQHGSIISFITAALKMLLKAYMQRFATTGIHRLICGQPQG
jgi:hypothetical protein